MSQVIFDVVSKFSKRIVLSERGYEHISVRHPEVSGEMDKMKQTLVSPQVVRKSMYDDRVWLFYRLFQKTPVSRKYLMVGVRIFNDDGMMITSYFTDKIKMGEELWKEK